MPDTSREPTGRESRSVASLRTCSRLLGTVSLPLSVEIRYKLAQTRPEEFCDEVSRDRHPDADRITLGVSLFQPDNPPCAIWGAYVCNKRTKVDGSVKDDRVVGVSFHVDIPTTLSGNRAFTLHDLDRTQIDLL